MICFECKENHPDRKPPTGEAITVQTMPCDYCGEVKMCFPDYKVLKDRGDDNDRRK